MTYTIHVAQSPIRFPCSAETTILQAAQNAGYEIPYSCRNGVCGSCKGQIVSGEVKAKNTLGVLSDEERMKGYVLFCQAVPCSDIEISVRSIVKHDPDAIKSLEARIHKITHITDDVSILDLRFPAGNRVKFKPGQYLQVLLEDGSRRNYSMANPSSKNDGAQLHIRHIPGGRFTNYLQSAAPRDILKIEIPLGDFYLRESNKPLIFVASGTGFAPIKSILETLFRQGEVSVPITFYWGARKKKDLYMLDLPERWASEYSNFTFIPVLSEERNGIDRTGFVHAAVLEDFADLSIFDVYACGAPAMIKAARRDFIADRQLPSDAFFCDAFVENH